MLTTLGVGAAGVVLEKALGWEAAEETGPVRLEKLLVKVGSSEGEDETTSEGEASELLSGSKPTAAD